MGSGAMIENKKLSADQSMNFQIQLMKTQMSLEDIMYSLAHNCDDPSVIISDRGLMDTAGYVGFDVFHDILNRTGWEVEDLRDNRYDAIIHLVTAADGAEAFYDLDNPARYENVEEAIERDIALRAAYVGHNKVFFIGNKEPNGFEGKMKKTLSTVNSLLGLPT